MIYVYKIINSINDKIYFGVTRQTLKQRFNGHKCESSRVSRPFYNAIKKYGFDKFKIIEMARCDKIETAFNMEIYFIAKYGCNYNIHRGGTSNDFLPEGEAKEAWKAKLKVARKGKKPSLGMKHSEVNKKLFKKVSRDYWDTQKTYNPEQVLSVGSSRAKELYGISKTHYHRLRRRALEETTSVELMQGPSPK